MEDSCGRMKEPEKKNVTSAANQQEPKEEIERKYCWDVMAISVTNNLKNRQMIVRRQRSIHIISNLLLIIIIKNKKTKNKTVDFLFSFLF